MHGTFDLLLVAVSYVIAVFGSYTALQLAGQVTDLRDATNKVWLGGAAIALGGGAIWSMHFIGMLAYKMPLPVSYDVTLTLLSMVLAIGFTGFGLYMVIRRESLSIPVLLGSGVVMGSGVAVMHYTGMAAMRFAAVPSHDDAIVAISLVIAIVASTAALWIAFTLRKGWQKFVAAFVMGAAVCGMHYTAMSGYSFTPTGQSVEFFSAAILGNQLAGYVAGATVVVLTLALLAVFAKELRSAQDYQ